MYMLDIAKNYASWSVCNKRKVGAVVVKNGHIISCGFNHGYDEPCTCRMDSKNPHVLHAEQMALCSKDREIYEGATIYVTYPPCEKCMVLIEQCKISEVIYLDKLGVRKREVI